MFLPIEAREKIIAALTGKDTALVDIARLRARLREAASLIPDFPVCQSLCSHTIRMAWESDRTTGKRTTHHLKMRRSRLFSYFASCRRLHADLIIPALNRAGDYACVLVPKKDRGPQWARFVEAGKVFGIYPNQLEHLSKHYDALYATH